MTSTFISPQEVRNEDPLIHLPCSAVSKYKAGEQIYAQNDSESVVYLVLDGKVRLSSMADNGRPVLLDIYCEDDFFGISALAGCARRAESAFAMEEVSVMSWTVAAIHEISTRKPMLAIAMMQLIGRRSIESARRIESFAAENITGRLIRCLLHLAEKIGTEAGDGSIGMIALTHETLSQYVGTSREIVTKTMNDLRHQGLLQFSRKGISFHAAALRNLADRRGVAA